MITVFDQVFMGHPHSRVMTIYFESVARL